MLSNEDGEPWDATVLPAHEFECHSRANRWRVPSLLVAEASSNLELYAKPVSHSHRTHKAGQASCPRLIRDYCGLSVLKLLDFKQGLATALLIEGIGGPEHHAFTVCVRDLVHVFLHILARFADEVIEKLDLRTINGAHNLLKLLIPFVKACSAHPRGIEDHKSDLLPLNGLILPLDNTDTRLEVISLGPEFAI